MIITKENERIYLTSWNYNAARIISELARIIENNNGRVKYGPAALISNRSITGAIFEKEQRAEKLKAINAESNDENKNEMRAAVIATLEKEIEELKAINNAPRRVTHTSYIQFILNNNYFYYQLDNNPFFEFYYIKTPVKNNKRSLDAAMMEDKKAWLFDCFFSWKCSDADIKEAAQLIFNMLCNAPFSDIMRDKRRERVPNRYNSGYHYETIYTPERIAEIDF